MSLLLSNYLIPRWVLGFSPRLMHLYSGVLESNASILISDYIYIYLGFSNQFKWLTEISLRNFTEFKCFSLLRKDSKAYKNLINQISLNFMSFSLLRKDSKAYKNLTNQISLNLIFNFFFIIIFYLICKVRVLKVFFPSRKFGFFFFIYPLQLSGSGSKDQNLLAARSLQLNFKHILK